MYFYCWLHCTAPHLHLHLHCTTNTFNIIHKNLTTSSTSPTLSLLSAKKPSSAKYIIRKTKHWAESKYLKLTWKYADHSPEEWAHTLQSTFLTILSVLYTEYICTLHRVDICTHQDSQPYCTAHSVHHLAR
jgi:hypothetical protein